MVRWNSYCMWKYFSLKIFSPVKITANDLVVGSGEKVHLFDTLTGELLWDYDIGNIIREIDISSNGSHIIVSGDDGKRYNDNVKLFN